MVSKHLNVIVASNNVAKMQTVEIALQKITETFEKDRKYDLLQYVPAMRIVDIESFGLFTHLPSQPIGGEITMNCAKSRAAEVGQKLKQDCRFVLAIESGVEQVGELWFQTGYVAVYDCVSNDYSVAGCSRFPLSTSTMDQIDTGKELSTIYKNHIATHTKSKGDCEVNVKHTGAVQMASGGVINRVQLYVDACVIALNLAIQRAAGVPEMAFFL